MRAPKIAYVGAGSTTFARRFLTDILSRPALAAGTIALMDVNPDNLALTAAFARKLAAQVGAPGRVETTTSRRAALDGADFVISTVLLFGTDVRVLPQQIAAKYGVHQAVGCSGGPGGVFRGLKDIPFTLAVARDMEELCPDALFLDYTNPTTVTPWAMSKATGVKYVALCHSVPGTARLLARFIGAPYEETGHWSAGVNHQAWMLRFEWNGRDAYPLVRRAMENPAIYEQEMVRFELMKLTGYFPTESSPHNSDFVPYFRKNRDLMERYKLWNARHHWSLPDAPERMNREAAAKREEMRRLAFGPEPIPLDASDEYSAGIMDAVVTNRPYRFNGRVMNTGLITNLPEGSCVEVPCLVDNMGVHPCHVGDLPPACAALNRQRTAGDELAVRAVLERDRWAAEQAIALDPLTASILTLPEIHQMTEEIFRAMEPYLWQEFRDEPVPAAAR
jgi:alpha-galactosidase